MTRTKISDRTLPGYTRKEEILNCITHAAGAFFAVAVLVLCAVFAGSNWARAGGIIYGASMLVLFTASAVYHGLKKEYTKKVWQVIDHCSVYIMIVGCYMPVLFTGVRPQNEKLFGTVLVCVIACAAAGAVFTAIDVNKYKPLTMVSYIGIGWFFVLMLKTLKNAYPAEFLWWVLAGGISITAGTVLYLLGHKHRYFHSVFHLAVDLGAVFAFIGIFKYCII
ncbi:MAG: hemolysin III family protein [Clostridia bacterium]|nr:hemolysin III family protein [Clostridia bacterium]